MRRIAILLFGFCAAAAMPASACETPQIFAAINAAAKARIDGNPAAAQALIAPVLSASPQNPRAEYIEGLILIDQANKDPAKIRAGLAHITAAADHLPDYGSLPPAEKACPENPRLYTIFNSAGVQFFQLGDKVNAEKYLLRGKVNVAPLDQASQAKIYSNLGLLYLNKMNLTQSEAYYTQAKAAGSPVAAARISAIRQIRGLGAAH